MTAKNHLTSDHEATFNRIVRRALLLPVGVMLLASLLLAWLVSHLLTVTNWLDHTDKVIAQAHACERRILDMQGAVQGYLITGDQDLFEGFNRVHGEIPPALDALVQEVRDNPPQVERLKLIRADFEQWAKDAADLANRRQHGADYQSLAANEAAMASMKAVRDELTRFVDVENGLRDLRSGRVKDIEANIRRLRLIVLMILGFALGLYIRSRLRAVARLYETALEETKQKSEALQISEASLRQAQDKLRTYAEDLERTVSERTAQLRETVGELESYSYSVSHDLRAPVRAIQGYAVVLLQDCGEQMGAEGKVYLNRIKASCERMDSLIQDVLTYSRINRTEITSEPVDLEHLLKELIQQYPTLHEMDGHIQIEGPLPRVNAPPALLSQALSNLLTNALKFAPKGTQPQVRVWTETRDTDVRIWVEDKGIGIAPQYQKKIFGVFERIPGETSYEGTGIGLAIVRRAVERMGGTVGVESDLGKGSRFWIDLPGRKL